MPALSGAPPTSHACAERELAKRGAGRRADGLIAGGWAAHRVILDKDRLSVARAPGAHLLVGRVDGLALAVPDGGLGDARHALVSQLNAPEAPAGESGELHPRGGHDARGGGGEVGALSGVRGAVAVALRDEPDPNGEQKQRGSMCQPLQLCCVPGVSQSSDHPSRRICKAPAMEMSRTWR